MRPVSSLRKSLRASLIDGGAFSLMVGCGETYLAAFVLAVGLGETMAGVMATAPMLVGAALQLASVHGVRWLGSQRRWVIFCAVTQGLCFLPLAGLALSGHASTLVIFLAAGLYWAGGLGAGPAWNTWMGRQVPTRVRAHFFAKRTRVTQVVVLLALLGGGALLETSKASDATLRGFAILFSVACAARLISAAFLWRQGEPSGAPLADRAIGVAELLGRLGHTDGRLLTYMLCVQVGTHVAASYFTPYMLSHLNMGYQGYVFMLAMAFVAKIVALPTIGRYASRAGARRLLILGGIGIAPLTVAWILTTDYWLLLASQIIGGIAWACYELATFLLMYETIPDEERTGVLSSFNFVNTLAVAVGAAIGAAILQFAGESAPTYILLFALSAIVRIATVSLLFRVHGVPLVSVTVALRTLSVRPLSGSLDAPILASIERPPPSKA